MTERYFKLTDLEGYLKDNPDWAIHNVNSYSSEGVFTINEIDEFGRGLQGSGSIKNIIFDKHTSKHFTEITSNYKEEGSITSSAMNTDEKLKIIDLLEDKGFKGDMWWSERIKSKTYDKGHVEFDTETSELTLGGALVRDENFNIKIDSVWHLTTVFLALGI